ncbi:MAG: hypothetical protein U0401_19415 [Anaerolineae bacterium]
MLGLTTVQVSLWLKQARQTTAQALPTKGYFDQACVQPTKPTSSSAGWTRLRLLGAANTLNPGPLPDYERVKLLLKRRMQ